MAEPADPLHRPAPLARVLARVAPYLVATLLLLYLRLPILLNAESVNSDASVVALQARHLLLGERQSFIWGSDYMSIADPLVVATFFRVLGATPIALRLAATTNYLVMSLCILALLRRHLAAVPAWLLLVPIVLVTQPVNTSIEYATRQSCSPRFSPPSSSSISPPPPAAPCRGSPADALGAIAIYLDYFALEMFPAVVLFAAMSSYGNHRTTGRVRPFARLAAAGCGAMLGLILVFWIRSRIGRPVGGWGTVANPLANLRLMWRNCLPQLLGYRVYITVDDAWSPPILVRVIQIAGALVFVACLAISAVRAGSRKVAWPLRRLALCGLAMAGCSAVAFVLNGAPFLDKMSARYLVPIILAAPLALAPLAAGVHLRGLAAALSVYSLSLLIAWNASFGPWVHGLLPVRAVSLADESTLRDQLRQRHVIAAAADYWIAYRLTFLWQENPTIVPINGYNRYAPYDQAFATAPVAAYLFQHIYYATQPEDFERQLTQQGFKYEELKVGEYTAVIFNRAAR